MKTTAKTKGLLFRRRYETAENQPAFYIDTVTSSLSIFRRCYSNNPHASGDLQSVALSAPESGHGKINV